MIKKLLIAALLLSAPGLFAVNPGEDDHHGSDPAVQQQLEGFAAAWKAHDTKKMASFWDSDGDLINPRGKWGSGRDNVKKVFELEQKGEGLFAKSTIKFEKAATRWIADNMVAVDVDCVVTGALEPKKDKRQKVRGIQKPMKFHFSAIMRKNGADDLKILIGRPCRLDGELEVVQ